MKPTPTNKGFTLIELLVVISIISLLSSILLVALHTTRGRAKDTAIKNTALEFRNLMELNYSEYGNYLNLQRPRSTLAAGGWFQGDVSACANGFKQSGVDAGIYATQARALCTAIVKQASYIPEWSGTYSLYLGTNAQLDGNGDVIPNSGTNGIDSIKDYSIFVWLPNKQRFFCVGSSGRTSETATVYTDWMDPGCWKNP